MQGLGRMKVKGRACTEGILEAGAALRGPIPSYAGNTPEAPGNWVLTGPQGRLCSLSLVSSPVRSRGQGLLRPSDPKPTLVGKSHQWGGSCPDAEITVCGPPGRARVSEQRAGNHGLEVEDAGWLL